MDRFVFDANKGNNPENFQPITIISARDCFSNNDVLQAMRDSDVVTVKFPDGTILEWGRRLDLPPPEPFIEGYITPTPKKE